MFFLSAVYGLGFVFYPFHVFSELLFSQSFSAVPQLVFVNEEFSAQLFPLMSYFCLLILPYFPLSQG